MVEPRKLPSDGNDNPYDLKMSKSFDYWGSITSYRAGILIQLFETNCRWAIIQIKRIEEDRTALEHDADFYKLDVNLRREIQDKMFADCQFYFILMNRLPTLLVAIYKATGFEELLKVKIQYDEYFKNYNEIRCHLEHIEERTISIKDVKQKEPKRYLGNFGNIVNGKYTFGEKEYSIDTSNIDTIMDYYQQVIEILDKHNLRRK